MKAKPTGSVFLFKVPQQQYVDQGQKMGYYKREVGKSGDKAKTVDILISSALK